MVRIIFTTFLSWFFLKHSSLFQRSLKYCLLIIQMLSGGFQSLSCNTNIKNPVNCKTVKKPMSLMSGVHNNIYRAHDVFCSGQLIMEGFLTSHYNSSLSAYNHPLRKMSTGLPLTFRKHIFCTYYFGILSNPLTIFWMLCSSLADEVATDGDVDEWAEESFMKGEDADEDCEPRDDDVSPWCKTLS